MHGAHRLCLLAMQVARIAALHPAGADDMLIVLEIDGVGAQLTRLSRCISHAVQLQI